MKIYENYSLKNYNSFGIEVYSKYFVEIFNENDLNKLYKFINENDLNYYILGEGSNTLFINDFNGTIIHFYQTGFQIEQTDENWIISANGGQNWDELVGASVEHGIIGLENLSHIPGSVGAAPIQNIGAYGVELSEFFKECTVFNIEMCEINKMQKSECRFSYRDSIFKNELKNKVLILSISLEIEKNRKLDFSYDSLSNYISKNNIKISSSSQLREIIISLRNSKIPLPSKIGNAGSFFKNPFIDENIYKRIKSKYNNAPIFRSNKGVVKISAGWLIEKCGFKGKRKGNVGTHKDQALVLVNFGEATGKEIHDFAATIQQKVYEEFGIFLETEVNIVK